MSIKSKIMKIGICSVMVLIPLSQTSLPSFADEVAEEPSQAIVNIPDPALKKEINQIIGQAETADITEAQMKTIRYIDLNGVTDLTGLEYGTIIDTLYMTNVNANSYEPITKLTNLKTLMMSNCSITSSTLPDLNGLTKLESLTITGANADLDNSSYSKFNQLPNLTTLDLSDNKKITDITGLLSLTTLTDLTLRNCQVSDFRGVETFPNLNSFTSTAQYAPAERTTLKSSNLKYNAAAQTMFLPFDVMSPSHLTNYDGSKVSPVYKQVAYMVLFNDLNVNNDRITASAEGLTIANTTPAEFDQIEKLTFWTVFNPSEIKTPPNLVGKTFNITGAGMEDFNVDHSANITAEDKISYVAGETVTPEKFLADIKADANGATITNDFAEKVDLTKAGTYTVTLNAANSLGVKAEPVEITVTIIEKTVITADPEITYTLNEAKTEAEFLAEIKAATNDDTPITSDFATAVDFTKAGEYTVTLNAESDVQKADPLTVKVKVSKEVIPDPDPEPTPAPDPTDPSDPADPADPAEPTNSADPVVSVASETPVNTVRLLPQTGDSLPVTGVVVGFLVLGLGVMIARKK
ncbi:LapB repeat-containing protein [Listeria sp. FSL L7-0478]|uniref:LapB repeat-containing protein n=1 Tax=Listeria cossartiae TaxID=2838249 RepID=UPI0016241028|nr:LapB repeat-containing protein [Listeria cossartiae]MBC1986662.1 LapB repeat-containing protein [Listeria cossartiae subsp. cossartiae]